MWPWYRWMPLRWKTEQDVARRYLTDVETGLDREAQAVIRGTYAWRTKYSGKLRDSFKIRIVYPDDFLPIGPRADSRLAVPMYPSVFLDSHHDVWQRRVDGHILSGWLLCLFVPGDVEIDFRLPNSLERVFEALHAFLVLQHHYQHDLQREVETGTPAVWPGAQRPHAVEGYSEAVRDRGGMPDQEPCVCGSGYRYGDCHKSAIQSFERKASERDSSTRSG